MPGRPQPRGIIEGARTDPNQPICRGSSDPRAALRAHPSDAGSDAFTEALQDTRLDSLNLKAASATARLRIAAGRSYGWTEQAAVGIVRTSVKK